MRKATGAPTKISNAEDVFPSFHEAIMSKK
jgi:hypothetical protein